MSLEKFYNDYLRNSYNKALLNQDEESQFYGYFAKNFGDFIPDDKTAEILDIGIGNGRTLRALRKLGYKNVFGIDIAKDLIEEAQKSGLHCEYVSDTGAFLEKNQKKYSFIYLSHIIEHIPKSESADFLDNARKALTDNGVLAIVVPNVQNIFCVGPFWDFTHVNFFTERSLHQVCEAAGFSQIQLLKEKTPLNIHGNGKIYFIKLLVSDVIIRISRTIINIYLRVIRFFIGAINPRILSFNLICICRNGK